MPSPHAIQYCIKSVKCVLSRRKDSVKPYTEWCFFISTNSLPTTPLLLHCAHNKNQLGVGLTDPLVKTSEAASKVEADLFVATANATDGRLAGTNTKLLELFHDLGLIQRKALGEIAYELPGTIHGHHSIHVGMKSNSHVHRSLLPARRPRKLLNATESPNVRRVPGSRCEAVTGTPRSRWKSSSQQDLPVLLQKGAPCFAADPAPTFPPQPHEAADPGRRHRQGSRGCFPHPCSHMEGRAND